MNYRALLLSLFLFVTLTAFAGEVYVTPCGGGCDNATNIQQAILLVTQDGTVPGTVVLDGNFELQTQITVAVPNLTLQAAYPGATLAFEASGGPYDAVIRLLQGSDGLTVRGLTIKGFRGVYFRGSQDGFGPVNNVSILNNTFVTWWRGILQWATSPSSTGWIIRGNHFSCAEETCFNSAELAVLVSGSKGSVENNVISYQSQAMGIVVQDSDDQPDGGTGWLVQANIIDSDRAINLTSASFNRVIGNVSTTAGTWGLSMHRGVSLDENGNYTVYGRAAQGNSASKNRFAGKSGIGIRIAAGNAGNNVIANKVEVSGATGVGIDLGVDDFNLGLAAATGNQVLANEISGGAMGIYLRLKTQDNLVTGNRISIVNPPLQGIVWEVPDANLVRGNPGFDPLRGSAANGQSQKVWVAIP